MAATFFRRKNHAVPIRFIHKNQNELLKKYNGQIIAVVNGECVGTYECSHDAIEAMYDKGIDPDSFIVILCEPGDRQYMARFHGNVTIDQVGIHNR
jgi:hypothetical protein